MAAPIYKGGRAYFGSPLRVKQDIVASGAATRQLKPSESGATFLFDTASGVVYTLPAARKGLQYRFVVTVTVTSNSYKVVAKTTATELFLGSIWQTVAAGTGTQFFPNGSSNAAIAMTGATVGGLINTDIILTCLSTTRWQIDGTVMASGSITTPFADS